MKRWVTFALLVFALHFGWEMTQGKWFASMQGLPFWHATLLCFRASLGDLVITAVAFGAGAAVAKSATWPVGERVTMAPTTFVAAGLAMAVAYEKFALSIGEWEYAARMPTVFGIGALPMLQWLVLPLAELALFRLIWRRGS